jgi:hypothetical protein
MTARIRRSPYGTATEGTERGGLAAVRPQQSVRPLARPQRVVTQPQQLQVERGVQRDRGAYGASLSSHLGEQEADRGRRRDPV